MTAHYDAASTRHFGAFRAGALLGIASLFWVEMPDKPEVPAFQLRGMAVSPGARGSGLGRALTLACIAFAREKGAELLWCNARTGATGFYRKLGFMPLASRPLTMFLPIATALKLFA